MILIILALAAFLFPISVYFFLNTRFTRLFKEKEIEINSVKTELLLFEEKFKQLQFTKSELESKLTFHEEQGIKHRQMLASLEATNRHLSETKMELDSKFSQHLKASEELEQKIRAYGEETPTLRAMNQSLKASLEDQNRVNNEKTKTLEEKLEVLRREKNELSHELTALKQQEPIRIAEYNSNIERLNLTAHNMEKERLREEQRKVEIETARLQALKETWSRHENEVEEKMRLICQQLSIDYVDKESFPFAGKPDNSVKICDEYIIFDGKSPQSDDLSNFPSYLKTQAEQAKKYAKIEAVKKDIFFVIPTNAISVVDATYISLGTYRVHIITVDAVRAILMQLQKIEDYEFADKLSPEDREKIITIIGKMAHAMKRRVQIDHYMANEFISILVDGENLPSEILDGAREVERSSKLNPSIESRAKRIETDTLKKESEKLAGRVSGQQIHIGSDLRVIDQLPLHTEQPNE